MRVLVTGGSGRAGVHVVAALAEDGHVVANVDRRPPPTTPGSLPRSTRGAFLRTELTDAGDVYDVVAQFQPDAVCHLAANPAPHGDPRQGVFANNVLSAYHVMQAAGDLGVRRVVYASSEMATGLLTPGVAPAHIPFDESERRPSPNAYALSKYLTEEIAESMSVRYPAMAFVGLRLSNVIPPDRYDMLEPRRQEPELGAVNFWSYVDARDVAGAVVASVNGDTTGHEVCLVAAADTCMEQPLRDLMAEHYDGYDAVDPGAADHASAFSCARMLHLFGWRPVHSWRNAEASK